MSYNLFLDDIRQPRACLNHMLPSVSEVYFKEWDIVRDYDQFVEVITKKGLPDIISFDHDLADIHYNPSTWKETFIYKEKTGYDCAKWLVEYCLENNKKLPDYLIHSMNPVGRDNIDAVLKNFKKHQEV